MRCVNDRHLTLKALQLALKRRCPDSGLLHHSDQSSTYASEDYQRVLDVHSITCSMSRRGDCYDNAVMEAFFSSLKSELADRFDSCGEAKMELFDYIEVFYNPAAPALDAWLRQSGGIRAPRGCERCRPSGRTKRAHRDLENRTERGFPQRPLPLSVLLEGSTNERRPSQSTCPLNRIRARGTLSPSHNIGA